MGHARGAGQLKVFCLGVTLDALTLQGDFLTVAVFEPALYDSLFGGAVADNAEGRVTTRALPFEANTIAQSRELGQLSSAALHLAWRHCRTILHR